MFLWQYLLVFKIQEGIVKGNSPRQACFLDKTFLYSNIHGGSVEGNSLGGYLPLTTPSCISRYRKVLWKEIPQEGIFHWQYLPVIENTERHCQSKFPSAFSVDNTILYCETQEGIIKGDSLGRHFPLTIPSCILKYMEVLSKEISSADMFLWKYLHVFKQTWRYCQRKLPRQASSLHKTFLFLKYIEVLSKEIP